MNTKFKDKNGTQIKIGDDVLCMPANEVRTIAWDEYHEKPMIVCHDCVVPRWSIEGREQKLEVVKKISCENCNENSKCPFASLAKKPNNL
jgi:hypothetical protein